MSKLSETFQHGLVARIHPWNQGSNKTLTGTSYKNGSLSKNVMKEDERVLKQLFH
jgi:hypothetical protein